MAVDKLVDSTQLDADLTSVANAIRTKGGTSASLAFPSGFVSAIADIPSGGGGQTIYTSSTGLLYTPIMTIDISMERNNGYEIGTTLGRYGSMPYLEELTLTGIVRNSGAGTTFPEGIRLSADDYPLLKKLVIAPTEVRNGSGSEYDPSDTKYNKITFGHYVFKNTNLTHLTIGKIGGPFFGGGGYYRGDMPIPPGTNKYEIGSLDGLEITLYTDTYRQNAGWARGVAPNTTAIQRDYITGEVLTS